MKKLPISLLLLVVFIATGCELVGDIFEAGFTVGIIAVVLVVGLIIYLIRRMSK